MNINSKNVSFDEEKKPSEHSQMYFWKRITVKEIQTCRRARISLACLVSCIYENVSGPFVSARQVS